jgi:hypothetical protein
VQADTDLKTAPVTVTRGLKSQKNTSFSPQIVSQSVHWIEGTFLQRNSPDLPSILSQDFVETKAFNGYTTGSLFADGRISMINASRPDMGVHILWQGKACDDCPIDPLELIAHLHNANFKFTRLDLAIDAFNYKLRPQRATRELQRGRCQTRAKKAPRRDDALEKGYTQSIGKKTSEIYLKLYDKAQEQGIVGDWTRVELTVRQKRANKAAWEIVRGVDFRGLVLAYAHFPAWREWNKVMAATPVKLQKQQTIGNTEKWLLDACVPALARSIFLSGNTEFYEKFKTAVTDKLIELSNNRQTAH